MKYARTYIEAHRNTESIDLFFQFPKVRLVFLHFLFTTQAYAQGAKWKKLLIHWNENQEKTTSMAFSFIALTLVEKAALHISLIMVDYVKRALRNRQQITSHVDTGRKLNVHKTIRKRPGRLLNVLCTFNLRPVSKGFKAEHFLRKAMETLKRSIISFNIANLVNKGILYFLYYERVTKGRRGRSLLHFHEN